MKNNPPPKLFLRFFRWYCHPKLLDHIEGDLIEVYQQRVNKVGKRKADIKFFIDVLMLFRPSIIKPIEGYKNLNNYGMMKSYFTIAARVIARNKFHSAINVFGLTIGLAFSLLMGVFIYGELQVNQELKDVDRLYFVEDKFDVTGSGWPPGLLTKEAVIQYPTIFESYYRFVDRNVTISKGDKHFRTQSLIGDNTFFQMFGFKLLHGNENTALTEPNSIVITEAVARQYFNLTDVVGETLSVSTERLGSKEYKVTAVIADPQQHNSVTDFMNQQGNVFLPIENLTDFFTSYDINSWQVNTISYIKLKPHTSQGQASAIINQLFKKNVQDNNLGHRSIELNPLKTYYRTTDNSAVQKLIYALSLVALFILLLAMVNFINISIASSFSRLKEVGVRKVVGGQRNQVVIQFLCESLLLALLSGAVALLVYQLSYSYFGKVLKATLRSFQEFKPMFWLYFVGGILIIGLLAGLYPSLYLSITKPIESLKGKFTSVKSTIRFSRGLIATQFTITLFIFVVSIVLSQQIRFVLDKDLGYDKSRVLIAQSVPRIYSSEGFEKVETAKHEFEKLSSVEFASLSWGVPGWNLSPVGGILYGAGRTIREGVQTELSSVDEDYLNVFRIKMAEGKFISGGGKAYKPLELVINETAQRTLKVNLGDKLKGDIFQGFEFTIVGIMKDFNYESLHDKVKPVAFMHNRDFSVFRYLSFKLENGNLTEAVEQIESKWNQLFPNDPFLYSFADERLEALYATEMQLKKSSSIGTVLMMTIVVTGVLGLVSLSLSKRSKEISIRKALGASVSNILGLISIEYVWLMIAGFAVGTTFAYWFSVDWLQGFADHIRLSWWMFVAPFCAVFLFTLCVVWLHSLKTAIKNPVDSLKSE